MTEQERDKLKYLMEKVTAPNLWPDQQRIVTALVVSSMLNDKWDKRLDEVFDFCDGFELGNRVL